MFVVKIDSQWACGATWITQLASDQPIAGSNPARLIFPLILNIKTNIEIFMTVATRIRAKAEAGIKDSERSAVDEMIADLVSRMSAAVGFLRTLHAMSESPQKPGEQQINDVNAGISVHRRLKEDVDLYWEEANRVYLDDPTKENKGKRRKIGSMQSEIKERLMPMIEQERARLVLRLRKDDKEAQEILDNAESGKNKWDFFGKVGLALSGVSLAIATIDDKALMAGAGLKKIYNILPSQIFDAPIAYIIAFVGLSIGVALIARERIMHYLSEKRKEEAKNVYLSK